MAHDSQHEAFLIQALADQVGEQDAALSSKLASCAECAREWRQLRRLEHKLEAAGNVQRQVLTESQGQVSAPDRARVAKALRELARGRSPAPPGHGGVRWLWAIAGLAAAVLVAWSFWRTPERDPKQTHPPVLLGNGVQCLQPVGESTSLGRFRWSPTEIPPGGYFNLSVWSVAEDGSTKLILEQNDMTEPSWSPADGERFLEGRIRWRVELLDADGQVGSDTEDAWLEGR